MNKKKNWKVILLVMILMFMGSSQLVSAQAASYSFTMGTSSTGGTVYGVGAGLASLLTENIPGLRIRAISTGGAADNVGMLSRGEVELALNASSTSAAAYNGNLVGMDAQKNLRGIASLYTSTFHFVVTKESGITSFAELAGTRGAVGGLGSAVELYTQHILGVYGLDFKTRQDFTPIFVSSAGASDQMKDGHIEWGHFALGVPGSRVIELAMSGKINILPIEGEFRERLLSEHPYYVPYTIPAGTYKGFDEPIETAACVITFVADESVDEEIVYQMTKTLWEKLDEVQQITKALSWMNLDNAYEGISVPLHPGAERYYKEIGVIK